MSKEMAKLGKIVISSTVLPKSEVIASCSECEAEIKRLEWKSYFDYTRQRGKLKKIEVCPFCKSSFKEGVITNPPKWERDEKGRMIAKCKDGDFMVWREGRIWKWRWRIYGGVYANYLGRSATKATAMKACERHNEWKKGGVSGDGCEVLQKSTVQ